MQVKISQAGSMIATVIKAKLVPMIHGSPGIGKSQVIYQIAEEYGLKVIDLRLSQCDPVDLLGFPNIKGNKAGYVPMDTFPVEGDEIPKGYNGWLLFLDEMNAAPAAVQAAAYKLILDRMVGMYPLHSHVAVVCAGNLETDNAIVETMSTALQTRLVHIEVVADALEWVDWANTQDIDYRICSFIGFKPKSLYTFSPDHSDKTYACPRTWQFASKLLKLIDPNHPNALPLLAGTLSLGVAREFISYTKIFKTLPTTQDIVANPTRIEVPQETSVLFALTGSISEGMNVKNCEALMLFVVRLPKEFQVVCLREIGRRNKQLFSQKPILDWIETTAQELF